MPTSDDLNQGDISKLIKNLNEKMNEFSSIIQKFGLDIITKMGQTNSKIKVLTDKVNKLDKATLDIKALLPKLNNIIDNQNILESEIDLLKSLIQRSSTSAPQNEFESEIERDESITLNKREITNQFKDLINMLNDTDEIQKIKNKLQKIKENIFEFTGGHKILYEISQVLNKINNEKSISESLRKDLAEKIEFWIVKIQSAPFKKGVK
jgi:DNA repair exonuclease SbcCD ATPase subunit